MLINKDCSDIFLRITADDILSDLRQDRGLISFEKIAEDGRASNDRLEILIRVERVEDLSYKVGWNSLEGGTRHFVVFKRRYS